MEIIQYVNTYDLGREDSAQAFLPKKKVFGPNPTQAESVSPPLLTRKSSFFEPKRKANFSQKLKEVSNFMHRKFCYLTNLVGRIEVTSALIHEKLTIRSTRNLK